MKADRSADLSQHLSKYRKPLFQVYAPKLQQMTVNGSNTAFEFIKFLLGSDKSRILCSILGHG